VTDTNLESDDPGAEPTTTEPAGDRAKDRTRTRTRTRRAAPARAAAADGPAVQDPAATDPPERDGGARDGVADAADPAEDPNDPTDLTDEGSEDDADHGSGRRRRRRGRRGRGRGRSSGAIAADDAPSREGARRGRSGPAGAPDEGPGTAEDDDGSDLVVDVDVDDDAAIGEDDESEVERAIARGGTRLAAKRGSRRGTDGGGGGGNRRQQRPGGVAEEVRRAILEGPPRTMLVTARADRTQLAVMEDRTVVEHYVTRKEDVTFVGNIYMARVQNVLPGMEAAFLDIGKGRNGVLYAGEVLYDELDLEEGEDQRIENVLKPGKKVLVQVTKDPMGTKGPRLTMHLSLAGRYLVLAPNSDLFGISRKLTDRERDRLRRIVKQVKPDHHGVIVRTAAEGATEEQITADIERLLAKWAKVEAATADAKALTTVYEEPQLVVKVIRDNFGPEFERCIVDDEDLYHQVRGYLEEVAPELLDKVELYGAPTADARARAAGAPSIEEAAADEATTDAGATEGGAPRQVDLAAANARREGLAPLFDAYDVTDQLRRAMSRKVWLPSGGYLIIEATEAMKVIDVNTGKFTGGKDTNLEEIVLKTNLEAADEIVRQLRLRDIGGIIVIDFIDMLLKSNQEQVVRRLKRELLRDRTKTRVSEVSRLGLVQMTRKNVSQGLIESFSHACEACEGRGLIPEID
jgi:Ribonuclease G/E